MRGILYIVTNTLNGKQYIGKTYSTLDKRIKTHVKDARKERNKNRPLYRAFNKYGVDKFKFIEVGIFEEGILEQKEVDYIKKFDTYKNGYNATLGGDGRRYLEFNDREVVNLYKKFGKRVLVAKELCCDRKTVRKVLNSNGIKPSCNKIKIKLIEKNLTFDSITNASKYLIDNGYTTSKLIKSVVIGLGRLLKDDYKNTLYGFTWKAVR